MNEFLGRDETLVVDTEEETEVNKGKVVERKSLELQEIKNSNSVVLKERENYCSSKESVQQVADRSDVVGGDVVLVEIVNQDGIAKPPINPERFKTKKESDKDTKEKSEHTDSPWCKLSVSMTVIGWIISIALCAWYTVDSSEQYIFAMNNPTTATSYVESVPASFPAITVCNWNSGRDCEHCNLSLRYATRVNPILGIVEDFLIPYEKVTIIQNDQQFHCYSFNNNSETRLQTNQTGYAGTISLSFQVPSVPKHLDARFGLQVSFHPIGSVPRVFSETNFAISGVDNYFVLTKVVTERLKPTIEDSNLVSVRWDTQLSTVELSQIESGVVVISFAYSSLNEYRVTELVTTSMEALLGQVAGIIGVL